MSLFESHPFALVLVLFGLAYLNGRFATPKHPRAAPRAGRAAPETPVAAGPILTRKLDPAPFETCPDQRSAEAVGSGRRPGGRPVRA